MTEESKYYPWECPTNFSKSKLRVRNSLTGNKDPFVPTQPGNRVSWYICGPTVYDSAHVGHASNYVRFDVVRRILSDYFGYDVTFQMNITDIDDKIITRANERGVSFEELAREFESEFLEDMDSLNVRRPDVLTRVSEYIPEVIEYIEMIIKNGFAYQSNGSVYFDTRAFVSAGYNYGKLEPSSVGNQALIAGGEGFLTTAEDAIKLQKKDKGDFVLWKKSKPSEPSWASPWGSGRPGWHIECSVVASNVLGCAIDIHAGGVDLRFPHHSNEIAQAEAHFGIHQWVNYFLHAGHLHIEGLKMSKSLKNFITIRKSLEMYSARQLRLAFLGHHYDASMNYSDHSMAEAVNLDRTFVDFFGNLKASLRENAGQNRKNENLRWTDVENELSDQLKSSQDAIHSFLADNFNTPGALLEIQSLVKSTNGYIAKRGMDCSVMLLQSVGRYISRILHVFGLTGDAPEGFSYNASVQDQHLNTESQIEPIMNTFSVFRDSIRKAAHSEKSEACKEILRLCDQLRDELLPPLGIRLEDRGLSQASIWKVENPSSLVKELSRKKKADAERTAEKQKMVAKREARLKAELERARVSPHDMFRDGDYRGRYSCFDNTGFPMKDANGIDLSKSAIKGLRKARQRQEKLYEKYLTVGERTGSRN